MLEERRLEVLRAIVEDFVSTNEPVGSKSLVERHGLRVSPATIRNDMASLEEEGYITHPHTSAGRMPTDKGYRLFVDRLSGVKPLSPAERRAIQSFLAGAVDLDDVIGRTVRLLAQLTRQVAVVQYPTLPRSRVRHVEILPLSANRLLVVLIVDTGRVDKRLVDQPEPVEEELLARLRAAVNERTVGRSLADAGALVAELRDSAPPEARGLFGSVLTAVLEALVEQPGERVLLAGRANLSVLDFAHDIRPVLEALEENMVLLNLLGELSDPAEVSVCIGGENPHEGLRSTSVVSSAYGPDGRPLARLGVLGPTRMDYGGAMGAVRAVARYVGRVLSES